MGILQELEHKNQNVAHLFRQVLDEEVGPVRESTLDLERLSGEAKQTIVRMQQAMEDHERKYNDLQKELKALKLTANRPGTAGGFDDPEVKKQASKAAFNKALARGYGALDAAERKLVRHDTEAEIDSGSKMGHGQEMEYKALYGVDATTGGFLTVPEYVNELIEAIVLVSDMHALVDVRMTAKPYVMIPSRTQTASATRIVEQATRSETQNPKFGLKQVFPYESYALTLISRTDLDDSELDLGTFIMQEFATQFSKLEGAEIINGTGAGANQCQGFLKDPNITGAAITSSTSGTFTYTDFTKLIHSLKTGYRKGATWVFTTESLGQLRGLTDNQGRPLWQPFGSDLPGQLFGYNYAEMPDMPQTALNGGASGAYAIAFGNFKTAYCLVIRKQVSVQVLQERYADQNAVGYMGYYRFGGNIKLSEAIKVMQIHA